MKEDKKQELNEVEAAGVAGGQNDTVVGLYDISEDKQRECGGCLRLYEKEGFTCYKCERIYGSPPYFFVSGDIRKPLCDNCCGDSPINLLHKKYYKNVQR